ncbi:MAG: hypothetical protein AB7O98_00875 [Hyphomonadaceae bacterium]
MASDRDTRARVVATNAEGRMGAFFGLLAGALIIALTAMAFAAMQPPKHSLRVVDMTPTAIEAPVAEQAINWR